MRRDYLVREGKNDEAALSDTEKAIKKKEARLAMLLAKDIQPVVPTKKEIGLILGINEEAASTRLFRARNIIGELCKMENN